MAQLLFENARLLDVSAGLLRGGSSVLVEDDRIVEITEGTLRAPGAARFDLAGHTLMPGLIDSTLAAC
jgi:imidazolonepropionase-like amidohydrolase